MERGQLPLGDWELDGSRQLGEQKCGRAAFPQPVELGSREVATRIWILMGSSPGALFLPPLTLRGTQLQEFWARHGVSLPTPRLPEAELAGRDGRGLDGWVCRYSRDLMNPLTYSKLGSETEFHK